MSWTSAAGTIRRPANQPRTQDLDAMVSWMADVPDPEPGGDDGSHHAARPGRRFVRQKYRLDVNTLHRDERRTAQVNDCSVTLRTTVPLFVDEYRRNRTTGSFILVDEAPRHGRRWYGSSAPARNDRPPPGCEVVYTAEVTRRPSTSPGTRVIDADEREARLGHRGAVLWLTGPSGSGADRCRRGRAPPGRVGAWRSSSTATNAAWLCADLVFRGGIDARTSGGWGRWRC
ncbi:MAG: hypothetical protein R2704_04120 [Microthrixaceae bacterium]